MISSAGLKYKPFSCRGVFNLLLAAMMTGFLPGMQFERACAEQHAIRLISPGSYEHLYADSIAFQWMHRPENPDSVHHYEIQIWSTSQFFRQRKRIPKTVSETGYFQYPVSRIRQTFRRHGQYSWRVSVIDLQGRQYTSDTRSFYIPAPELSKELSPWFFPYEVQWQAVQPVKSTEFLDFLKHTNPASHLDAFSNIRLLFRQDQLLNRRFRLTEAVFIHSRVGLGGEFGLAWRMLRNRFVSLYPGGWFQISKFSTGIGPYTSLQYDGCLGGSIEIMPRALVVLSGGWIPIYHVRYQTVQDEARRFSADGWEVGIRFVIPKSIIKPISLLGLRIDPQRFPFEFQHRQVRDSFSEVSLQTQSFGIGYVFR